VTVSHIGPRMRRREFLTVGLALSVWPSAPRLAFAQSRYPDRPIRLVIPFPPGGGYDAVGRPWAERIKPLLGTIVVENAAHTDALPGSVLRRDQTGAVG